MVTQAARHMPLCASAEYCEFALHEIRHTNGSGRGFGTHWPWYEVLIRPRRGVFSGSPGTFIDRLYLERPPAATDAEVLNRVVAWLEQQRRPTRVSVNVHPESLISHGFVNGVIAAQRQVRESGHSLCLELVEFGHCSDRKRLVAHAAKLRAEKVLIALDDFGSRLNFFDLCAAGIVDIIKVDTSVVSGVHRNRNQRAIAESVWTLANGLEATVVAEGVESADELEAIRSIGIDFAQGFFFHKPEMTEI